MAHAEAAGHTSVFAGGATRSGKTAACMLSFAFWLLGQRSVAQHGIVGQSLGTVMRNIGFPLQQQLQELGCDVRFKEGLGARLEVGRSWGVDQVWLFGADDAKARRRIQGATLRGLIVEEAPLLPEDMFMTSFSRLSEASSRMWCTYNPEGPRHWFKRRVIDRREHFGGYLVDMRLTDNPGLEPEVRKRYEEAYEGHFKRRMIHGEWAGASGVIWASWSGAAAPVPPDQALGAQCSLDWAVSSVFGALLHVQGPDGRWVVQSELFWDVREEGYTRTEEEQADALTEWVRGAGFGSESLVVWVDPSTPNSFLRLLRRRGFRPRLANNAVVDGIVVTGRRLKGLDIRIWEAGCPNLCAEIDSYAWDERKSEQGEDAPVKANDHLCDALRYFAFSTGQAWLSALGLGVEEVLYGAQQHFGVAPGGAVAAFPGAAAHL